MFTSIKLYIYGAIAAAGLFLVGLVKYLSSKNAKLEKEVEIVNRNVLVLEKKDSDRKELNQELAKVKDEANRVQHEINEKRNNKVRPNIGDKFGDPRL